MPRVRGRSTAQHIAQIAAQLFYQRGIHVVGVDSIADAAGVTKRTLYRHFRSKDELLAAALRCPSPLAQREMDGSPEERILQVFQQVIDWVSTPDFRGCPVINAAVELTDRRHPARLVAREVKERRRQWFRGRGAELSVSDPDLFAEQMMVLFDGALASATVRGPAPAFAAKDAAVRLVQGWRSAVPAVDGAGTAASEAGRRARSSAA